MLLGAVAQAMPDIDFISSFWEDTPGYLLAHRGFTHSILFALISAILFSLVAKHLWRTKEIHFKQWLIFFGLQGAVHITIDLFNAYGTGLLEPFDHTRFSWNSIFVADPFFSIWTILSFGALLFLRQTSKKRIAWQRFGIMGSALYLIYCGINKLSVDADIKTDLDKRNIVYSDYLTTPAPFNNWLWYVVIKQDTGFYVGYRSVFDRKNASHLRYFSKNKQLLNRITDTFELRRLIRFSRDYYTIEKWNDTLVFNDLRFGQMVGWHDPGGRFVFHYYLEGHDKYNKTVVQRGRFAKWDRAAVNSLITRVIGN